MSSPTANDNKPTAVPGAMPPEIAVDLKVYYGEDVSTYAERSSLPGLLKTTVPLLVTDAELDPDNFQADTNKLAAARAAAGKPVERVHLGGHSHISETYAVGTQDRSLSQPVLEFVRDHSGGT